MPERVRRPSHDVARRPGREARCAAAGTAALLAAALLAAVAPAAGQAPDSSERVERLRDRQRDFERHRRLRFPPTGGAAAERCDERVGRYCLFHGDGDGWEPRPEDPGVRRRRARLIDRLAAAARALPGDGWIAGQRVRYLVAADRAGEAAIAARACRAEAWWCTALEAFARHHGAEPGRADSLFGAALRQMSAERRRRWIDPTVFLGDDAAAALEELAGEERRARLRRLWWLSDPLWTVPGRGRRNGHLARRVRCRLQRHAAGPYGTAWGDDLEELTLRYGWPVGWQRVRPGHYGTGGDPEVVAHHAPWARRMAPPAPVLEDPAAAGPGAWPLDPEEPHAEYAPPGLDTLARPTVRWTSFPRPDSLRLVAAWRWEAEVDAEASLRVETGPDGPSADAAGRQRGGTGRLAAALPAGPAVASLELIRRGSGRAARHRAGIRPPERPEGVPGLSGLLLTTPPERPEDRGDPGDGDGPFRRSGPGAAELASAAERARAPGPVLPGERVGLYWESYGPEAALRGGRTSVRLVQEEGGFLDDVARGLGLAGDPREVSVSWSTAPAGEGRIHPSGVVVTLPSDLEPGRYRLEVTVRPPGREPLEAGALLRLREAPDG